jgi:hypothetical protein
MKWIKKGLIYCPDGGSTWAQHSALTPTPILLDAKIRIYAGFRDNTGVSRIGYVDVAAEDPKRILMVSQDPVLDVGSPGMFDDNGVILGDIIAVGNLLYMYYIGFQLVQKIKFLAFTGLAISSDRGNTFNRLNKTPVMDRTDEGTFIRAIHSIVRIGDVWKVWYAAGSRWVQLNGMSYPAYHIKYLESENGTSFANAGHLCIECENDEYRIGRPRVYKRGGLYSMFYTKGTTNGGYLPGYAESNDGINWQRKDRLVGIGLSEKGWDSQTVCYPSLLKYKNKTYMFYNGNDMGKTGLGFAELKGHGSYER